VQALTERQKENILKALDNMKDRIRPVKYFVKGKPNCFIGNLIAIEGGDAHSLDWSVHNGRTGTWKAFLVNHAGYPCNLLSNIEENLEQRGLNPGFLLGVAVQFMLPDIPTAQFKEEAKAIVEAYPVEAYIQ